MATFEKFRATFPEDEHVKGKRFETFLCHWLLKKHPVYKNKFRKVWHFEDWPKRWSPRDIGTDLIAEDTEGKICAIQAKFYRAENYIPKGHVDSFLADSSREIVDYRLLIATTDRIGINAKNAIEGQAIPVQMFLLTDFLSSPLSWPSKAERFEELKAREAHDPKPHQYAAIDDVCAKLKGRGQLIMACGTGKTLTGQRVAEKLEAKTTLVLLPSLLLLSKTVSDWLVEAKQDFRFLPVCSDSSVTKKVEDEIELSSSELSVGTTTDANEIASFLKQRGNKVIFSTYQSSPKIAEAFTTHSLKPFDLIIADEAHRCAGESSADYSTVLDGELLPAKHRLFMTATPRTFKASVKKKAKENDIEKASMDDESLFGPVLHHLTFGQAIANDPPLLTDYRVLVIGVNEESVREMVEERTLVRTEEGVEDDARSLAIQVGLAKAIRDYDLKRVITFHSKIKLAKNFASSFNEIKNHFKVDQRPSGVINYEYVSGKMPTSERSNKLRALGALEGEDRYLLANARCLSEGVDVPALDGVAFVDPKRSQIDIIQAVGRAIRLSEDKETGTIVIPVFLNDSDDPDEVISASEFDQVWNVVKALRSHDETLGEELDELRVQLGRKQKISLRGSRIVFDVHQDIGDEFIEAFETKLVETNTEAWEFWFDELKRFFSAHNHTIVPRNKEFKGLNRWVGKQRHHKETMRLDRRTRLDSLNFIWSVPEHDWLARFNELRGLYESKPSKKIPKTNRAIGGWVDAQRSNRENLEAWKVNLLNSIDFDWDPFESAWQLGFETLKLFFAEHGATARVSQSLIYQGFNLGSWARQQRLQNKKGKLPKEKVELLNAINFIWDQKVSDWEYGFACFRKYVQNNNDAAVKASYRCPVCTKTDGSPYPLGTWVSFQRSKQANLTKERRERLLKAGFIFDIFAQKFRTFFDSLKSIVQEGGNPNVSPSFVDSSGNNIGYQLVKYRTNYKNGLLSQEQIKSLLGIGVSFSPNTNRWDDNFSALRDFTLQYGIAKLRQGTKHQNLNIGTWLTNQRRLARSNALEESREKKLRELGAL